MSFLSKQFGIACMAILFGGATGLLEAGLCDLRGIGATESCEILPLECGWLRDCTYAVCYTQGAQCTGYGTGGACAIFGCAFVYDMCYC